MLIQDLVELWIPRVFLLLVVFSIIMISRYFHMSINFVITGKITQEFILKQEEYI
jgi:hypothetical protein